MLETEDDYLSAYGRSKEMQYPSTTKTEHRALNALEAIIDQHRTMDYQFNGNDKEMSWDGYIWLYKENNGDQSGKNFDARVPVQIKGHHDRNHEYLNREKITYPVRLIDLEAYSTERGVLYFEIFLDGKKNSIFYASLYPSKIADFLEAAKEKGNNKTYKIPFHKLQKEPEKIYIIAKQFASESQKQGSAYTPLVQDRIRSDDFSKLKSINLTVIGAADSHSALQRLSSGDVCLYGKTDNDDKYYRPLEWLDSSRFYVAQDIHKEIAVGDEVFYRQYKCFTDSDDDMVLILSPNLRLRVKESRFNFNPVSTLSELYLDARFILKFVANSSFFVGGYELKFKTSGITCDFENRLKYIIDLYEVLKMIDFAVDVKFSYYTEDQQRQLIKLINLRHNTNNVNLKDVYTKYLWNYDGKSVPLIIVKDGNNIEFINSIYTDKIAIFLPFDESGDERGYKMPLFVYQDADVLSNLYHYDYEAFKRQIDDSDINEVTSTALLEHALLMINVFDRNGNQHFLELAEYLLQKLKPYITKEILLLNRLQIRKRLKPLSRSDIARLRSITGDDMQVLFGKSVLLGDANAAKGYFDCFPADEQERYKEFPIYKLYCDLL